MQAPQGALPSGVPIRVRPSATVLDKPPGISLGPGPTASGLPAGLPPPGLTKSHTVGEVMRNQRRSLVLPAPPHATPSASPAPAGGGAPTPGGQIGQWLSGPGQRTSGRGKALTDSFQSGGSSSSSSSSGGGGGGEEKRNKIKAQYQFLDLFLKKRHTRQSVFGTSLLDLYKATNSPVPLIVLQCIEYLREHGRVQGIFRQSALMLEMQTLKDQFTSPTQQVDIAAHITEPHACAVVLKQFFADLPEPIVPFSRYDAVVAAYLQPPPANVAALKQAVATLPVCNLPTLKLLFEFLADFVRHADVTLMSADNLGIVFGPNLLRPKVLTPQVIVDRFDSKITTFLIHHYAAVFDDLDLREIGIASPAASIDADFVLVPHQSSSSSSSSSDSRPPTDSEPTTPTLVQTTRVTKSTRRATVLWDWVGQSESEVSCRKNEIVTLLDNDTTTDWRWVRTAAGVEGYIARSYLQDIVSEGVSVPASLILKRRNTIFS